MMSLVGYIMMSLVGYIMLKKVISLTCDVLSYIYIYCKSTKTSSYQYAQNEI